MSSGIQLNPREVLDHLHELGYTNITPDQLKEFIKDLKKLIKYDQRRAQGSRKDESSDDNASDSESSPEKNEKCGISCEQSRPVAPQSTPRHVLSPLTADLAESNIQKHPPTNYASHFNRDHYCNIQDPSTGQSSSDNIDSRQRTESTRSNTRDEMSRTKRTTQSCSAKENHAPTRSSSFIRPWKYQSGGQRSGHLTNRSDPVALYHKYQALWQKNKIPGEEAHSGLRWNIRERMLGQDPQPRPISQASSLESMPRKRVVRM
ncbi:hyls1 centriolar and ciliogenesis associated [Lycorma delicatula]|uniref:hyls1 centriolar and ciliogenesis associated n=1 Tax=Lycorma delicatula TaxID=130591 RepID=UPI003F511027